MREAMLVLLLVTAACSSHDDAGVGGGGMMPGDNGGGGGGSGGAKCSSATPFQGAPIDAPDQQWTWIDVDGAFCRDGSATGIGVYLNKASDKLLFYLEGGGACFNAASCYANAASFGADDFEQVKSRSGGIFNLARAENPFAGWNVVYVPYCTGDVHFGAAQAADVPKGPTQQKFVGYANITHALARLVPTLPGVTQVVLSGASAGGFGASLNYDQVAQAFCSQTVTMIDDSGPPMNDDVLSPCLQQRWRTLWNFDANLPADCAACKPADGGGIVHYAEWLANKYPTAQLGLIASDKDAVISRFYGYGQNNCAQIDAQQAPSVPGATFHAGLLQMRDEVLKKSPAWSTFLITSTQHTWIGGESFYSKAEDGVTMVDWVRKLVGGQPGGHLGPN